MEFFAKAAAVFWGELLALLIERGALEKLIDIAIRSWIRNMQPQLIEAAKSNGDDDAFIDIAKKEGWGDALPAGRP